MKYKECCQHDAPESRHVIPLQLLAKVPHRKYRKSDHFLDRLELCGCKFVGADAIGRNLKTIFKKRDPPTCQDDLPQRLAAVLEVAVPRKRHENIREGEQQNCSHNVSIALQTSTFRRSSRGKCCVNWKASLFNYRRSGDAGSRRDISRATSRISSWMVPFVASIVGPPRRYGFPSKSLTFPPASSTSNKPAAVSHFCSPNSQNPSNRPQATQAKSSAAEPSRRTPCERKVKSQ